MVKLCNNYFLKSFERVKMHNFIKNRLFTIIFQITENVFGISLTVVIIGCNV